MVKQHQRLEDKRGFKMINLFDIKHGWWNIKMFLKTGYIFYLKCFIAQIKDAKRNYKHD